MKKGTSKKKTEEYNKSKLVEGLISIEKRLSPYDKEILKSKLNINM
jgi:hypothetical protein